MKTLVQGYIVSSLPLVQNWITTFKKGDFLNLLVFHVSSSQTYRLFLDFAFTDLQNLQYGSMCSHSENLLHYLTSPQKNLINFFWAQSYSGLCTLPGFLPAPYERINVPGSCLCPTADSFHFNLITPFCLSRLPGRSRFVFAKFYIWKVNWAYCFSQKLFDFKQWSVSS